MITLDDIKTYASAIAQEAKAGANTAWRIGNALLKLIEFEQGEREKIIKTIDDLSKTVAHLQVGETAETGNFVRKSEMLLTSSEFFTTLTEQVKTAMGETGFVTQATFDVKADSIKQEVKREIKGEGYATQEGLSKAVASLTTELDAVRGSITNITKDYVTTSAFQATAEGVEMLYEVKDGKRVISSSVIAGAITDASGNLLSSIKVSADNVEISADKIKIGDLQSGIGIGGFKINGTTLTATDTSVESVDGGLGYIVFTTTLSPMGFLQTDSKDGEVMIKDASLTAWRQYKNIRDRWYSGLRLTPDGLYDVYKKTSGAGTEERIGENFKVTPSSLSIIGGAITWNLGDEYAHIRIEMFEEFMVMLNRIASLENRLDTFINQYNSVHGLTTEQQNG